MIEDDDDLFPRRPPRISRYGVPDNPKVQLDGEPPEEGVPELAVVPTEELPSVEWSPIRCPECRSRRKRTYGRREVVRWHKCLSCKTRFKSIEAPAG